MVNGVLMAKNEFNYLQETLQKIDCKLDRVAEDVSALKDHVKTQNGRLEKVEDRTDFNSNKIYLGLGGLSVILITKQIGLW